MFLIPDIPTSQENIASFLGFVRFLSFRRDPSCSCPSSSWLSELCSLSSFTISKRFAHLTWQALCEIRNVVDDTRCCSFYSLLSLQIVSAPFTWFDIQMQLSPQKKLIWLCVWWLLVKANSFRWRLTEWNMQLPFCEPVDLKRVKGFGPCGHSVLPLHKADEWRKIDCFFFTWLGFSLLCETFFLIEVPPNSLRR